MRLKNKKNEKNKKVTDITVKCFVIETRDTREEKQIHKHMRFPMRQETNASGTSITGDSQM